MKLMLLLFCIYVIVSASFHLSLFFKFRQEGVFAPEAGHARKVFAVRFHPFDDNIFLTGGWDRCIKVCTRVRACPLICHHFQQIFHF